MKSKITKLAAAAAIILIAVLGINLLDKSVSPAYAIEQTIEAINHMRYFHFKYLGQSDGKALKEAWVEYDESGQIENVRVNFYKWGGQDTVMVWKQGKTQHWNKNKNILEFFEDEIYTAKVLKFARRYDPKGAVEHLYKLQAQGEVKIEIDEPSDKAESIIVTGTYLPGKYLLENPTLPAFRDVLFIDQATKLVTSVEIYELKEGKYIDRGVWVYQDYNKPFAPEIFSLEDEVPEDIERIDLMTLDIGLEQGGLTDGEIATQVVRQFLKALIAKDYILAGKLYGGMSADKAQERFTLNILRIISIDEPVVHGRPPSLRVPCTIEIEEDGEIREWQPSGLFVHRVIGQPSRWSIIGGF